MVAGHLKVKAALHIAGPRAQGLQPYSDGFASRHAWTTPHDAYSAYPASEVILHALAIYVQHIWNSSAGLAPSIPSRRTMHNARNENTMERRRRGEVNVSIDRGIESP